MSNDDVSKKKLGYGKLLLSEFFTEERLRTYNPEASKSVITRARMGMSREEGYTPTVEDFLAKYRTRKAIWNTLMRTPGFGRKTTLAVLNTLIGAGLV